MEPSGRSVANPPGNVCPCAEERHDPRLVVVTGGPGAGKTAVLEMARRSLCRHVLILPEAAGTEDPETAAEIDARIVEAWQHHPNRTIVGATAAFLEKVDRALNAIAAELPSCCNPAAS